jgi:hypothetical protein
MNPEAAKVEGKKLSKESLGVKGPPLVREEVRKKDVGKVGS